MPIANIYGSDFIDVTGQQFNHWTVLQRAQGKKKVRWECRCKCGTVRIVGTTDLRSGKSKSCGCGVKDRPLSIRASHSREYNSWTGMKQRCYYKKHIEYQRYGGRGITVCDTWRSSFAAFLRDMGTCPDGLSLDRIDLDGNYEPGNCRWATVSEQMNNTCKNVEVIYDGRSMTLKNLAIELGVNYFRLHAYYRRRGLTLEEAIAASLKPGINRPYRYKPEFRGV